jgi:hypothetical protein
MKFLNSITAILVTLSIISSCRKDEIEIIPLASLNVTVAIIEGGNVKYNTNLQDSIKAYNSRLFPILLGTNISLSATKDPRTTYYDNTLDMENGKTYSLFLSGFSSSIDAIFTEDNIPSRYSDSVIGIRVINLSRNSRPLNISLGSANATNIFSKVVYKQITEFKTFAMRTLIPPGSITFRITDEGTNALLATYTLPASANSTYPGISIALSRFKNLTLVIKGLQGVTSGIDAFGVFPVANY